MPNHITNRLTIIGTDKEVAQVRKKIRGEEEDTLIDFNKITPIPEKLKDTKSPMEIISQEKYEAQEKRIADNDLTEFERKYGFWRCLTGEVAQEYKWKYGHTNWYDWTIANWGTKWNAYSQYSDDVNVIHFDTAWNTPYRLMVNLSRMFPEITFEVEYADEDFGYNVGKYVLLNGESIEENIPDGGSKEAIEMAMDVKNEEEYYLNGDYFTDVINDEDGELSDFAETLIIIAHERGKLIENYPVVVLKRLKELALADQQSERIKEIDELLKTN